MKHQKLFTVIISVVFALTVLICLFFVFSVKEVKINFNVTEKGEEYSESAQNDLDKFMNGNLLFLNTEKVKTALEKYAYFDIIEVKKVYPNRVEITVNERQEGYFVKTETKGYILDVNGFCLKEVPLDFDNEDKLIELYGISFSEITVGKPVVAEKSEIFEVALTMAKAANLNNCIETMTVDVRKDSEAVLFETKTDVGILVSKVMDGGVEKTLMVFGEYDNMTDYEKSYYWLNVYRLEETGEIKVVWTSESALSEYLESLRGSL